MHTVKRSFYIEDYKILIEFDNNKFKIVDLKNEIWGPVFEPLKDVNYFKKVKAKGGTIVWPNEADFCPDVLYKMGQDLFGNVNKNNRRTPPASNTEKPRARIVAGSKR